MRLYFLLVRRVPPVQSPILAEVFHLLARWGFHIETGIAEEALLEPDKLTLRHDLYVLKSHTELSHSLAGVLHRQRARLLNPYPSCLATQNKIVVAQCLRAAGVPIPRCWVTADFTLLRPVAEQHRLIIKPYMGHRGAGIRIVDHPDQLAALPPPEVPVLVQEFVSGTGEDLKVYVVGEQVFAVRKLFSPSSFTQPGEPCAVSAQLREMALRCGWACGLGLYGLDVIEGRDGPVVVDVNYFPGYKGVPQIAPRIADYIAGYARGEYELTLPPQQVPLTLPVGNGNSAPWADPLPLQSEVRPAEESQTR